MNLSVSNKGNLNLGWFVIVIIVGLFAVGIFSIFLYLFNTSFFTMFDSTGLNDSSTMSVENSILGANLMLDWVMVLFMIMAIVGIAVLGYRNTSAPINFIIIIFLAIFLGLVSYLFNYLFYQIVTNSTFASVVLFFPNTILICTNLHWLSLGMLIVGSFATFTSNRSGQVGL